MLISKKYISFINFIYIVSILFIYVGNRLLVNGVDEEIFYVFHEMFYLPIVFGLPILSVIIIRGYYKMKNKPLKVYLCLALSILICVLFCVKIYYGVFEETLLF
jgi:predicted tellurium resistance membrane protein TerC